MSTDDELRNGQSLDGSSERVEGGNGEAKGKSCLISRRQALFAGVMAGAGLVMPWKHLVPPAGAQVQRYRESFWQDLAVSPPLTKWAQALTFPTLLTPSAVPGDPNADGYNLFVSRFTKVLHPALPATTLFGYGPTRTTPEYPGPTIIAIRNRNIVLNATNNIRGTYPIPVDTTIAGANPFVKNNPPFCIHLHGGEVPSEFDGNPVDRFAPGSSFTYRYPNTQEGATLWYHDHALGVTRLNVIMGMAGFYPLHDPVVEGPLGLPVLPSPFDVPLAIQDRIFNADGSFFYPTTWAPEYFGDVALVNGLVWPFHNVKPGWHRIRLLNGCNARVLNLSLKPAPPAGSMYYIASDGGFLRRAVPVPATGILIAPGERYELMINFGGYAPGTNVRLVNNAPTPYPTPVPGLPVLTQIMQFRVRGNPAGTPVFDPATFAPVVPPNHDPLLAVRQRYLTLFERVNPVTGAVIAATINNNDFLDPATEDPAAGDLEVWNIINSTVDAHPIHTHQVMFNVISRQRYDQAGYLTANPSMRAGVPVEPFLLGAPRVPRGWERAWKDTVVALPGQVTKIAMKWGPYKGNYVYHCHILDHEDNEMMRPMIVK